MTSNGSVREAMKITGKTGLSVWHGTINEEEQLQLKPLATRLKIFREMRRDTVIGTGLDGVKLPLLAADFDTTPASESEVDVAAATFIHDSLGMERQGDLDAPWLDHVLEAMEALEMGFALSEMTLVSREDGLFGMGSLTPIGQETLSSTVTPWELGDHQELISVHQKPPSGDTTPIEIPAWKLLHFTLRSRKRNPEGESILAGVWRDWRMRTNFEELEGIGVERDVGGMPVIYPPTAPTEGEKTDIDTQMGALRNDQRGYIRMPGPKAGTTRDTEQGWTLEPYASGSKAYNVREIIKDYDIRILMRFFTQFLMLGMDTGGTQALVKGSHAFLNLALRSIQQKLLAVWNRQLVPFMLSFNEGRFQGMTANPVITWSDPGAEDLQALTTLYTGLTASKVLTITKVDEDHVRAIVGLPDRPEGVGEGDRNPQPIPGLFPPSGPLKGVVHLEGPGGQKLRPAGGAIETGTNAYQIELVGIYDNWSTRAVRAVANAQRDGLSISRQVGIVDAMLGDLQFDLQNAGRTRLVEASQIALAGPLAKHQGNSQVLAGVSAKIAENDAFIRDNLIPDLRVKFSASLESGVAADSTALRAAFDSQRHKPAQFSGGYWVMAFDVQRIAGIAENALRKEQGLTPIPVRWDLDPAAEHCDNSSGFFGCPSLAGVYTEGWESLATVPGGQVTCRGNCRCTILADFGEGFAVIT